MAKKLPFPKITLPFDAGTYRLCMTAVRSGAKVPLSASSELLRYLDYTASGTGFHVRITPELHTDIQLLLKAQLRAPCSRLLPFLSPAEVAAYQKNYTNMSLVTMVQERRASNDGILAALALRTKPFTDLEVMTVINNFCSYGTPGGFGQRDSVLDYILERYTPSPDLYQRYFGRTSVLLGTDRAAHSATKVTLALIRKIPREHFASLLGTLPPHLLLVALAANQYPDVLNELLQSKVGLTYHEVLQLGSEATP